MSVLALSFLAALALALVEFMGEWWTSKIVMNRAWLSFAGGSAVAYVFLHLLPELGVEQARLGERFADPPLAGHALYLAALVSLAAFFGLERACTVLHAQGRHPVGEVILHFGSFGIYNAIIGYLTVQRAGIGPGTLLLFVVAIGMHSILNTHGLSDKHQEHLRVGRWVLSGTVLLGWGVAAVVQIPPTGQAFLFAFLAGGITLNVLKEELPAENQSRFGAFGMGLVFFAVAIYVVAQFFPGAVEHPV